MMPTLDSLLSQIQAWQKVTFSSATSSSALKHLASELGEAAVATAAKNGLDPDQAEDLNEDILERLVAGLEKKSGKPGPEYADIFFLLAQAAQCDGVDLTAEINAKLQQNRGRLWGAPQADGIVEHLEVPENDGHG